MAIHVVLYQPDIPANTGNIALTCAATDTSLHLIRPLGFSTDAEMIKRAGFDFWESVNITYYDSMDDFFSQNQGEFYYIETFGEQAHSSFDFSDASKEHYFMFGKETTGLPKDLLEENKDHFLRIPMNDNVRSLNLSSTAAILVYEALRQQGFPHLK
ncbi:tRNA (uridine(34)/cytosine(34)/5-carboxymethylaminomethyluridine(34)-2'-O)-methyltransferase TrmL [Bacillus sp. CMF12]|uniref:tRNA (uridine(34)/cytosine(34)/5- carboxymethylaminomethyluridine(34)-2'-O)- methyltransferase TrmL n=1 Tax=Bacillaceae TaxID=186817 RepID=UPI001FB50C6A|nr:MULTISPECIES: tRNA (uridine(34)/cytosine(34)/5-carboxymethylaminomethyluridine(34)-2'-O)-methyltransferase TrmL [Bacillaceae]MDF2038390.1 tRNA (uridine(34)/cytosine(34)/5-carboxymethylaminomethyluridine(34)-2'-O)-methyltransferase TrmL [Cytobacillus oceanisediminis]UOE56118.1 tRNA (uridine(34)/cytosine(34)/5-carboxymethylaminomethyluridine(34)-2'-O)-methyltransferase TrmL [Cytobacillus oceanisediminis]USK50598.1 tRNA (uridine(34)/cytosine(34)/5-carboxymethylaminomethyluridine(34)-2'-O)-methyl